MVYLAVTNSSIGDLVPCLLGDLVGQSQLTIRDFTTLPSDLRDFLPLTHLTRVTRGHCRIKKDNIKDNYRDKYILETCDL